MYAGKTLFAQVMEFVPWTSFARIVQRHGGNAGVRTLSCAEQFGAMSFAQLTWRESLRDIEVGLSANASKLYAMGFRSAVRRSTLADANESRDWRIWSDLAAVLIRRPRNLYASESPLGVELDNTVYALDSSAIDLCLSLFAYPGPNAARSKPARSQSRRHLFAAVGDGMRTARDTGACRSRQLDHAIRQ